MAWRLRIPPVFTATTRNRHASNRHAILTCKGGYLGSSRDVSSRQEWPPHHRLVAASSVTVAARPPRVSSSRHHHHHHCAATVVVRRALPTPPPPSRSWSRRSRRASGRGATCRTRGTGSTSSSCSSRTSSSRTRSAASPCCGSCASSACSRYNPIYKQSYNDSRYITTDPIGAPKPMRSQFIAASDAKQLDMQLKWPTDATLTVDHNRSERRHRGTPTP